MSHFVRAGGRIYANMFACSSTELGDKSDRAIPSQNVTVERS